MWQSNQQQQRICKQNIEWIEGRDRKGATRNLNENLKQLRNACRKNKVRVGYNGGRSRVYKEKRKGLKNNVMLEFKS